MSRKLYNLANTNLTMSNCLSYRLIIYHFHMSIECEYYGSYTTDTGIIKEKREEPYVSHKEERKAGERHRGTNHATVHARGARRRIDKLSLEIPTY